MKTQPKIEPQPSEEATNYTPIRSATPSPIDTSKLLFIKSKFILQIDGRRFQYERALYDRRRIPIEQLQHPYFQHFVAETPEDISQLLVLEPEELEPIHRRETSPINSLRNRRAL